MKNFTVNQRPWGVGRLFKIAGLVLPVLIVASCASTKYTAYHDNTVIQGQNGIVYSYNGIEIWRDGTPDRKYRIIGVINDPGAQGKGFVASMKQLTQSSLDSELASQAKAHGGDAVIILPVEPKHDEYGNSAGAAAMDQDPGFGPDHLDDDSPAKRHRSVKALVVKYVTGN